MTKPDFAGCMAFLSAGVNKPMSPEQSATYWDMLRDLPLDVLRIAVKRVLAEHKYASIPSIAAIREAAAETILKQVAELPASEAWDMAHRALSKYDPDVGGPYYCRGPNGMTSFPSQMAAIMANLPPLVAKAVRGVGHGMWGTTKTPTSILQTSFLKAYDEVIAKHKRLAVMPAALKAEIEGRVPASIGKTLDAIGVEK